MQESTNKIYVQLSSSIKCFKYQN
jgi:hypothetical protein